MNNYKGISEMKYHSPESKQNYSSGNNNGFDFKNNNIIKIVAIVLVSVLLVIGGIKVVGSITGNKNVGHISSSSRTLSPEECVEEFWDVCIGVVIGLMESGDTEKVMQYFEDNYPEIIVSHSQIERELEEMMDEMDDMSSLLDDLDEEEYEEYEELMREIKQADIDILSKRKLDASELEDLAMDAEDELDETITFEKGWIVDGEVSLMGEVEEMEFTVLQCNGKRAVWATDGEYIWEGLY